DADNHSMSTGVAGVAAPTKPSRHQRRAIAAARKILGGKTDIRADGAGRVEQARMTNGAQWTLRIFSAVSCLFFVLLPGLLVPGLLVVLVLYESVKPRRGVAVTSTGVVEFRVGGFRAMPLAVLARTDRGVLDRAVKPFADKVSLTFGS